MKKQMKDNKGFTLVELIIVIAIIAILLALITPNLTAFLGTAEDTAAKANAKTAYTSAFAWATSQKAAGTTVTGNVTLTKAVDATSLSITTNETGIADADLDLDEYFTAGEIPDGAVIAIEFNDNAVTSVSWDEDGAGAGTATVYPES